MAFTPIKFSKFDPESLELHSVKELENREGKSYTSISYGYRDGDKQEKRLPPFETPRCKIVPSIDKASGNLKGFCAFFSGSDKSHFKDWLDQMDAATLTHLGLVGGSIPWAKSKKVKDFSTFYRTLCFKSKENDEEDDTYCLWMKISKFSNAFFVNKKPVAINDLKRTTIDGWATFAIHHIYSATGMANPQIYCNSIVIADLAERSAEMHESEEFDDYMANLDSEQLSAIEEKLSKIKLAKAAEPKQEEPENDDTPEDPDASSVEKPRRTFNNRGRGGYSVSGRGTFNKRHAINS